MKDYIVYRIKTPHHRRLATFAVTYDELKNGYKIPETALYKRIIKEVSSKTEAMKLYLK